MASRYQVTKYCPKLEKKKNSIISISSTVESNLLIYQQYIQSPICKGENRDKENKKSKTEKKINMLFSRNGPGGKALNHYRVGDKPHNGPCDQRKPREGLCRLRDPTGRTHGLSDSGDKCAKSI